MTCRPFVFPDGVRGVICTRGERVRRCACGAPAEYLCDAPKGKRRCSAPLCARHTARVGELDYCHEHAPPPRAGAVPAGLLWLSSGGWERVPVLYQRDGSGPWLRGLYAGTLYLLGELQPELWCCNLYRRPEGLCSVEVYAAPASMLAPSS